MKRIFVSLPDGIWKIIKRDFKEMGESESEIIRTIVIAYLQDMGYMEKAEGGNSELKSRLKVLEGLVESLIDVLEEKTDVTYEDVDKTMRRKIAEMKP